MDKPYIEIILEDKIYMQRTSMSKIIEFDVHTAEEKTYNDLPRKIKDFIAIANDMKLNPDKYFEYENYKDGVEIKKMKKVYPDYLEYVEIPSHINGLPIRKLGQIFAYEIHDEIVHMVLPETIEEFSKSTFENFTSLRKINIPSKVKEIPDYCFYNNKKLLDLDLSNITHTGIESFFSCNNFKRIYLPKIKEIDKQSFYRCEGLQDLIIDSPDLNRIKSCAFENCNSLLTVILPDQLEKLECNVFNGCELINELVLPENLKKVESGALPNYLMRKIASNMGNKENLVFMQNDWRRIEIFKGNKSYYDEETEIKTPER